MDAVTLVITAAAGATVKRVLGRKLGKYTDPGDLLDDIAIDTVQDLLVTAVIEGGVWVITQVIQPSKPLKHDPKVEAAVDSRLKAIRNRLAIDRDRTGQRTADRLRLFNEVKEEIEQLEYALRTRNRAYSAYDLSESVPVDTVRTFVKFTFASMRGVIPDLGKKQRTKIRFRVDEEFIELKFGWSDSYVVLSPTRTGKVKTETVLSKDELGSFAAVSKLSGTRTSDRIATVMRHVNAVVDLFLTVIEARVG